MRSMLVALVVLGALAAPAAAQACSCAVQPESQRFASAKNAVILKLVEVRDGQADLERIFIYEIKRIFKASDRVRSKKRIKVRDGGTSCAPPSELKRYGVYLSSFRGEFSVNSCNVIRAKKMRRVARRAEAAGRRAGESASSGCSAG